MVFLFLWVCRGRVMGCSVCILGFSSFSLLSFFFFFFFFSVGYLEFSVWSGGGVTSPKVASSRLVAAIYVSVAFIAFGFPSSSFIDFALLPSFRLRTVLACSWALQSSK
jgi:hypothetical protein